MKEIAGEYFLGDLIGEPGSSNACKLQGYFKATATRKGDPNVQKTDAPDMTAAHQHYIEHVSRFIEIDKKLEMPNILSVEATALNKYNTEAGVNIPLLELFNGNPDELVPTVRGSAKACRAPFWGTYVAHEWYGGMRHDDALKRKLLELGYKFAYLSGSNVFCLESGDECITAYGHRYGVKGGTAAYEAHARAHGARVAIYGHTHIPEARYDSETGMYIFNPGSIGRPYHGRPTFGLLDILPDGSVVLSHGEETLA
jgi:diadenosine tetraphosphatase ApaH/serine/threonine PP2A family protein phosphatase